MGLTRLCCGGPLAWLSWVVARLDGWNCYYKPPGPKTMASGGQKLSTMLEALDIAAATRKL